MDARNVATQYFVADEPEQFMAEVERNLITPASLISGNLSLTSAAVKKISPEPAKIVAKLPHTNGGSRGDSFGKRSYESAMDMDDHDVLTVYPTAVNNLSTMDALMNDSTAVASMLSSPASSSAALPGNADDDRDDDDVDNDFNQDEAYVHAGHAAIGRGLNFALNVPREIQKV